MTDAPETIWAQSEKCERGGRSLSGVFRTTKLNNPDWHNRNYYHEEVEYHRADLPPTPAQIIADPRVQALVEALKNARHELEEYEAELRGETYNSPEINAALAALEKP